MSIPYTSARREDMPVPELAAGDNGAVRAGALARAAAWSGSVASVASMAVLAYFGRAQRKGMAPVNAPSHWLWRDEALRQHRITLRHTLPGYLIHHGSSVFWAVFFERLLLDRPHTAPHTAALALAVAGIAAGVDLRLTPRRLTPGFEHHLSARPLAILYGVFGVALYAAHALRCDTCRKRRRHGHSGC